MSRVVTATVLDDHGPHLLAAASRDEYDPIVRGLIADATTAAYERGRRVGHDEGVAAAVAHNDRVATAVATAAVDAARAVRAATADVVDEVMRLAVTVASTIMAREPHDGGAALAEQLRVALAQIEDDAPVVEVHPDDVAYLTVLTELRSVAVEADPSLAPGEARIRGGWANADLTRAAAFAAVKRTLDVTG